MLKNLVFLFFLFQCGYSQTLSIKNQNISTQDINSIYKHYKNKDTNYFLNNTYFFKSKTFSKIFIKTFPLNYASEKDLNKILKLYSQEKIACNLFFLLNKPISENIKKKIEKILFLYCPYEPYVKSFKNRFNFLEDIYKRAKLLFKNKEFQDAFYYAKKLPLNQDKYLYLKARIYYANRKRKLAVKFMEKISEDSKYKIKKYYFLSLWKKNPADKLYYFNKLLKTQDKIRINIVLNALLNNAFYSDNETYFETLLNISKKVNKNLYGIYGFKDAYLFGDYKKAKFYLSFIKDKNKKNLYTLFLYNSFGKNYNLKSFLNNFTNYNKYKIILEPPKKIYSREPKISDIKNPTLKKYLKKDKKFTEVLLELYKFPKLDKAITYYFLGDYYSAIKCSYRYLNQQKNKPFVIRLIYPRGYKNKIKKYLKLYNSSLPENYIYALIRKESLFNKNAVSWAGARGLMQIMPFTAKFISKKLKIKYNLYNLTQVDYNLKLGIWYVNYLSKRLENLALVSGAYNAGIYNIYRFLGNDTPCYNTLEFIELVEMFVRYPETRNYILETLKNLYIYNAIYKREGNHEITCTISP